MILLVLLFLSITPSSSNADIYKKMLARIDTRLESNQVSVTPALFMYSADSRHRGRELVILPGTVLPEYQYQQPVYVNPATYQYHSPAGYTAPYLQTQLNCLPGGT